MVKGGVVDTPNPETDTPLHPEADLPRPSGRPPLDPEADNAPLPPVETTTEAGGTHPTGMHSCFEFWIFLL